MTGKEKCKLLRLIRKEIAETNGIVYITADCNYEGDDCLGTCPKCDDEIAYLDAELNKKIAEGEGITLAGLSLDTFQAGIDGELKRTGCSNVPLRTMDSIEVKKSGTSKESYLRMTIEELDLSVCSYNHLKQAGIETVGDLTSKTIGEIIMLCNMETLDEVESKLELMGLSLEKDFEDDEPLMGIIEPLMGFI